MISLARPAEKKNDTCHATPGTDFASCKENRLNAIENLQS